MRRTKVGKIFKGSVFVTFGDKETALKFVENEATKKYKDIEMTKLMQETYWANKQKQQKEKKAAEKKVKSNQKSVVRFLRKVS